MAFKYVSKLYNKLLRRLSPMSSPEESAIHDVLPTEPSSITEFVKQLRQHYRAHGPNYSDFDVLELRLLKSSESLRHEYVTASVKCPFGHIHYIAFERLGEVPVADAQAGQENLQPQLEVQTQAQASSSGSSNSSTPSLTSLETSSLSLSSPSTPGSLCARRHAKDRVTVLEYLSRHRNDTVEITLTIDPKRPLHLYELAILADTIHTMNVQYLLISRNCYYYYYAGILANIIEAQYKAKMYVTGGAGMCGPFPVVRLRNVSVDDVVTEFRKDLESFRAKVENFTSYNIAQKERRIEQVEAELKAKDDTLIAQEEELIVLREMVAKMGTRQVV